MERHEDPQTPNPSSPGSSRAERGKRANVEQPQSIGFVEGALECTWTNHAGEVENGPSR
jgi:hypothetical protein